MAATIIAIANEKGGVGKTTTALNLGAELAAQGYGPVLLIDFDPQSSLTLLAGRLPQHQPGWDDERDKERRQPTIYDVVGDENPRGWMPLEDVICSVSEQLDLAPSDKFLVDSRLGLDKRPHREYVLKRAIKSVAAHYRFIIIDVAPAQDWLFINSLMAAEWVIAPVKLDILSVQGIHAFVKRLVVDMPLDFEYAPRLLGVLATEVPNPLPRQNREIAELLQSTASLRLFEARIPRSVAFAEAAEVGAPMRVYAPRHVGTEAYAALAREVVKRATE